MRKEKIIIENTTIDNTNIDEVLQLQQCKIDSDVYIYNYIFKNVTFENCSQNLIKTTLIYCEFINVKFINCEFLLHVDNNCSMANVHFIDCNLELSTFGVSTNTSKRKKFIKILFENCNLYNASFNPCGKFEFVNCKNAPEMVLNKIPLIGYKYTDDKLVILEIPKDALYIKNSSGKCRANKAKVLSILNIDGTYSGVTKTSSYFDSTFIYQVDHIVTPNKKFNMNIYNSCNSGIHFFITQKDAEIFYNNVINYKKRMYPKYTQLMKGCK